MKKNAFILFGGLLILATACSDNKEDSPNEGGNVAAHKMYILNQGSMDSNNANISLYLPSENKVTPNYYLEQNRILMGDNGQQIIKHDGYMYVALFGSNYIAKLDSDCKLIASAQLSYYDEFRGGVRSIAADDRYIYASFYGGVVARFNARDLSLGNTGRILKNVGSNLEQIVVEDDKLYVADSYAITTDATTGAVNYEYLKEIKIIDLDTFTLTGSIEVAQNPNSLLEEDDKLFLISYDYYDVSYPVQMIDPKTSAVTKLGYATCFASDNDIVYMVDSRTDYTTNPYTTHNSFWTYNVKTGVTDNNSFLKDAPEELQSANIMMMAIDDETGDIYIASTFYTASNGIIYRFKADGTYVGKFDCGGQNPIGAVFF